MENFTAYNPTTLHFGKNVLASLETTLKEYGNRVLLVYGRGSVKSSGLYDLVMNKLVKAGFEVCEYGGHSVIIPFIKKKPAQSIKPFYLYTVLSWYDTIPAFQKAACGHYLLHPAPVVAGS